MEKNHYYFLFPPRFRLGIEIFYRDRIIKVTSGEQHVKIAESPIAHSVLRLFARNEKNND
jgi:hypothetical protein